jgi:hypothetical protein
VQLQKQAPRKRSAQEAVSSPPRRSTMRCCGNAGYNLANCTDLGEVLETVKVIAEGHVQSWYTAWKATADRVLALADRTQNSLGKGGTHMRGSTCERAWLSFCCRPTIPSGRDRSRRQVALSLRATERLASEIRRRRAGYAEYDRSSPCADKLAAHGETRDERSSR